MFAGINELSVVIMALLGVALGSIWYSPLLFGELWMKSIGITPGDLEDLRSRLVPALGSAWLANVIFFFLLAHTIRLAEAADVSLPGVGFALLLFISAAMSSMVVWEKRPLSYVLIHIGYAAVLIFGGLGIIHFWPW